MRIETDNIYAEMATAFEDSGESGQPVSEKVAQILKSRFEGKLSHQKKKQRKTNKVPATSE